MSKPDGWTHYDIVLDDGTDKTGLMLATDENGRKLYEVTEAPTFEPRMGTDDAQYAQFPPLIEMVAAWDNWLGGFGAEKDIEDRYAESHYTDPRYPHQIILGPLITTTGTTAGAALGEVKNWNAFAEFGGELYLMTDDDTNTKIWKWNESTSIWDEKKDLGNIAPGGLVVYKGWLVAYALNDISYSTDGTNWTDVDISAESHTLVKGGMCVIGTNLWRAYDNSVKSCTDPTAYANWSTATAIGDSSANINCLLNLNNVLYVGKEDGLFSFDETTVVNLTADYKHLKSAYNFQSMTSWQNEGYFSIGESGFIHYDPSSGTFTDISPLLFSRMITSPDMNVMGYRVEAIAKDENWLYIILYPKAQGEYCYIVAGAWQTTSLGTTWVWHPILEFLTADSTGVGLRAALVTTATGTNPELWIGESYAT